MPFQQGLGPFIFAAAFMAISLLIQWAVSRRMDPERAWRYTQFANAGAMFGALFGTQLRTSEYLGGEFYYGRTDTLPGPSAIMLMLGIYASLRVLVTSYVQYRKNRDDPELSKKLIKDAVGSLAILSGVFAAGIFMEALQRS
ncbi:hypothetical protein [Papillibacter cinnamivorans]|uniref:Uncharacterized protein n=1 Tax=Papillibacter cinnamivorans DSM 12816 TaxID=1122930 RepID=A0A1W2BRX0_9FIRM|nr:hypothetical protein [Papillibacter cinnamivorans]SMC75308.1 hypothetical protein SAMN02745168_2313 [Papillibacter cinnamivorans DSM 12816]